MIGNREPLLKARLVFFPGLASHMLHWTATQGGADALSESETTEHLQRASF